MLSYHRLGEQGEALRAYERLRMVLLEELGADPGPETETLFSAILRGEDVDDGRTAVPATGMANPDFVGRDREMGELLELWAGASSGVSSCALIVGDGGIGKSRLAAEVADEVRATGATVLRARCYEAERSLFLQPIIDILREAMATLTSAVIRRAIGERARSLTTLVPELAGDHRIRRHVGGRDRDRAAPDVRGGRAALDGARPAAPAAHRRRRSARSRRVDHRAAALRHALGCTGAAARRGHRTHRRSRLGERAPRIRGHDDPAVRPHGRLDQAAGRARRPRGPRRRDRVADTGPHLVRRRSPASVGRRRRHGRCFVGSHRGAAVATRRGHRTSSPLWARRRGGVARRGRGRFGLRRDPAR